MVNLIKRRRRSHVDKAKMDHAIERAYSNLDKSLRESASLIGISYEYMTKRAHFMGIKRPNKLSEEEEFWIWQLRKVHKLQISAIAEKFDVADSTICQAVKKYDEIYSGLTAPQGNSEA